MRISPSRRALLAGAGESLLAQQNQPATYTYKTVSGLKVQADVVRPPGGAARPVVVWIHGGALIMGNRAGVTGAVRKWAAEREYVLVSIDYRLAPETPLPGVIEDVEDAFAWVYREGPRLFGADPKRIAAAGGSAGGYLTLTAGFRATPRPVALLSLFGYGDLIGDWYSTPSPHARHQSPKMERAQAYAQVSGPPVSDSRDRKGDGGAFYQHCRQTGFWPMAVTGWDPKRDEARFVPYMPLRNVTKDYPPTVMMHGTADTDVPYEQSVLMAKELARNGVRHELITIANGEHGFGGGDPAAVAKGYQSAFAFVDRLLEAPAK